MSGWLSDLELELIRGQVGRKGRGKAEAKDVQEQSSRIIEENCRIWLEVEREETLVNSIER